MNENEITKKNLWFFPLGTIGRDMVYNLVTTYLYSFVLFTHKLTPAQLTAIGAIMVCARIFDALNDPIMGNIIERTRSRWGKFKPWQVIGILTTSLDIYLAFNVQLQGWRFVIFFGLIYFAYSITYTMHDIAYWGMVPALSSDADTRNRFTSLATLCAGIGGTIAGSLIPMLTAGKLTIGGNAVHAYGVIALIIAILAPAFLAFTVFGVRDQRDYNKDQVPSVSFKKIWTTITRNDQLLWISLIFLIQEVGNGIVLAGMGATYIYFEFGYNGGLYTIFNTVGMAVTSLLMIFYPAISRKLRRKQLMNQLMLIAVIGYAVMLLPALILKTGAVTLLGLDLKFICITLGYMLANFGQYGFYLIMMISIMNTVEYNEEKFGIRDEGIISSLRPFLTKLASAITIAIANLTYIAFHLLNYTNGIAEQEQIANQKLIEISPQAEELGNQIVAEKEAAISTLLQDVQHWQSHALLLVMTLVPCLLMFLSFLLYKKHYTLDEPEYERICRELEARKEKVEAQ